MKKTFQVAAVIVLCVLVLFTLSACGGSSGSNNSGSGSGSGSGASTRDTLNVAVDTDPRSLDWRNLSSNTTWLNIAQMISEPLWDVTQEGEIKWILATSIDYVTPAQWVIHLREDVYFTNGNPFDAGDCLLSYQRSERTSGRANYTTQMDWENCRVIDDTTFEMNFYDFDLAAQNALRSVYMCDAESYEEEVYTTHPIGTGPYVLDEYVQNSHVYVSRNEDYWGEPAIIPNIRFRVLGEPAQKVNALLTGIVDFALIDLTDVEFVSTISEYDVMTRSQFAGRALNMNYTDLSPLNSPEARRAVGHAIDREAIIDLVYAGYADESVSPIPSSAIDMLPEMVNRDTLYSIGHDPELARQLAEQSGLVGKELRIITNGTPEYVAIAEILQQNLRDIGVNATITNFDTGSWRQVYMEPEAFDINLFSLGHPSGSGAGPCFGYIWSVPYIRDGEWEEVDEYVPMCVAGMTKSDVGERQVLINRM